MNNQEFIKYTANRFGVDENFAKTMVDMFAESLQELVKAGQSVTIDEIGEFKSIPLFPNGLNHKNNTNLQKASKKIMINFKASSNLVENIA